MKTTESIVIHKTTSTQPVLAEAGSSLPALPPVAPPATPAQHFAIQCETIRQRSRSLLSQISEEQRLCLFGWLDSDATLDEVRRRVAAPPPEGFGLQTHHTTLQRIRSS